MNRVPFFLALILFISFGFLDCFAAFPISKKQITGALVVSLFAEAYREFREQRNEKEVPIKEAQIVEQLQRVQNHEQTRDYSTVSTEELLRAYAHFFVQYCMYTGGLIKDVFANPKHNFKEHTAFTTIFWLFVASLTSAIAYDVGGYVYNL